MRKHNLSIGIYMVICLVQLGCGKQDGVHMLQGSRTTRSAQTSATPETPEATATSVWTSFSLPPSATESATPVASPSESCTPIVVHPPHLPLPPQEPQPPAPPPVPAPVALQASVSGLTATDADVVVGPSNTLADLVSSPHIGFYVSGNLPIALSALSSTNSAFQIAQTQTVNAYTVYIEGFWFATAGANSALSITATVASGNQTATVTVSTNVHSHYPAMQPIYLSVSPVNGDNLYSTSYSEGPAAGYTPQNLPHAFQLYVNPVVTGLITADVPMHRCHWANDARFHFVNNYNCAGQVDEGVLGYAWRVGPLNLSVNLPGGSFFRVYRVYENSGPRAMTDYSTLLNIENNPQWGLFRDIDYSVMVLN